jgi:hypothetical protein
MNGDVANRTQKQVAIGTQAKRHNAKSHNFAVRAPMAKSGPISRHETRKQNKGRKPFGQEEGKNLSCKVIASGVCAFVRSGMAPICVQMAEKELCAPKIAAM